MQSKGGNFYACVGISGTSMIPRYLIKKRKLLRTMILLAAASDIALNVFAFPEIAAANGDVSSTRDAQELRQFMREHRREQGTDQRKSGSRKNAKPVTPKPKEGEKTK